MRKFQFINLFILALATGGCFEYDESIKLFPDFSGFVRIKYQVPLRLVDGAYQSYISSLPFGRNEFSRRFTHRGVELVKYDSAVIESTKLTGNSKFETKILGRFKKRGSITATLKFKHIRQLSKVLPGRFELIRQANSTKFRRHLQAREYPPGKEDEIGLRTILSSVDSFLGDRKYSFSLEAPPEWLKDNSCANLKNNECRWNVSLSDLMHGEATTVLEATLPLHPAVP